MIFASVYFGGLFVLPIAFFWNLDWIHMFLHIFALHWIVLLFLPIIIAYLFGSNILPNFPRVIENSILMKCLDLEGLAIYPVIFLREKALTKKGKPSDDFTHESIHYLQQQECLVVPFYFFYMFEESFRAIVFCRGYDKAYEEISFEREAYKYEKEYEKYKRNRKCCARLSFCKLQLN